MAKTNYEELLEINKEFMAYILKMNNGIEKLLEKILEEIKHIKDSIYLQEKYHRGH